MAQALTYFYYFFNQCITFVFSDMTIQSGVTVGWVIVSVMVMGMLVRSILNVPRGINLHHSYETKYYDSYGKLTGSSTRKRVK